MSKPPSTLPYPPVGGGTSLVDRMNISIHLRKYFKLFARRWWIVLVCALITVGQAVYKAKNAPDIYQASSRLGIAPRIFTAYDKPTQYLEAIGNYYDNQLDYMRSLRGRVNHALADYRTPTGKVPVLMSAEPSKGSGSTFTLAVQSDDFEYARRYSTAWAREFIKYKDELKASTIDSKVQDVRQEKLRYEQSLQKIRTEMQDFRKAHNIASAKDAGDAAQKRLDQLTAEYMKIVTERQLLENKTAEELAQAGFFDKKESDTKDGKKASNATIDTADVDASLQPDSAYNQLRLKLKEKEADLQDWSVKLKSKHPFIVKLQNEIKGLQRDLKFQEDLMQEQRLARIEAVRKQQAARIESLKKDEKSYEPLLASLRKDVLDSGNIQYEYDRLIKEEASLEQMLDTTRKQLSATETVPSNEEQITTVDEGVGDNVPIGPDRKKMILNGLLMGMGIGIAIIFLLHRLDDRLELAEDIEDELEEPVLGQIPQQDTTDLKEGRLLITQLEQHNMFVESIRGVRSAVMFGSQGKRHQVMIVTSAVPGDGKTTFTVNFAATLANAGNRVLLIDADLRRGNIHHYFDVPREPGLSEVLGGQLHWGDVVRETGVKSLHIITSGQLPSNPGELLISPVTREFIEEAKNEYDHILFDCPPLTAIDDTFCLLSLSDGLLFIVKAGQTSMRFAKNALTSVRQRGAEIIGVVLNGITTDHPSYYYNYYYHAYYNKELTPANTSAQVKPAKKMAERRRKIPSIDIEAQARAGQMISSDNVTADERKKAEQFKARRAAQRQPTNGDPASGAAGDSPSTSKPKESQES